MLKSKKTILVISGVLLLALIFTGLELSNTTHLLHSDKNTKTDTFPKTTTSGGASADNQKGEPQDAGTDENTGQPGDEKSNQNGSGANLVAPSGSFVSNHRPYLSGSPAPNTVSSVCTTTPGASCTIKFTQGSVTKSLSSQTTDKAGSAYWNNWSLQDVGLTTGTWKVTAVASLGGQSQSTDDAIDMVVAQ